MAIIEEALENLSKEETLLHNKLKNIDEDVILEYAFKRKKYKEITKEEMTQINEIYEEGSTIFEIKVFDKPHKMRLLSQKEKISINSYLDKKFNAPITEKEGKKNKFFDDDFKQQAILENRIVATVAMGLVYIDDDDFDNIIIKHYKLPNVVDITLEQKIEYIELLPPAIINMLYNRYLDHEVRIFDIFQFESVRKK